MNNTDCLNQEGRFEARYLAFLETITQFRPSLHRYYARMTGSVMDCEDVVKLRIKNSPDPTAENLFYCTHVHSK